VDLDIRAGETVALVGESGSGKSSVGRALVGIERVASGSIKVDGEEIVGPSRQAIRRHRASLQMVFQDSYGSLNPRSTIGRIVGEPLSVHAVGSAATRQQRVYELLERVGLDTAMTGRYPHELSGGQRQRIAIARALALNPRLIVCDEPVSALDVSVQAQVLNLLVDIQREYGIAYLFISHDLSVVRHIAHHVVVMYLGKFVSKGARSSFWTEPTHPYTRRLLQATPTMSADAIVAQPLSDEIPSARNPPSGCRFRSRCEFAISACADAVPPLRMIRGEDSSACLRVGLDDSGVVRYPWTTRAEATYAKIV
jgi:oligopeptide/dipeptide ABC transporter ATP-binding protein